MGFFRWIIKHVIIIVILGIILFNMNIYIYIAFLLYAPLILFDLIRERIKNTFLRFDEEPPIAEFSKNKFS
ncbi:MAG: hypothetical protein ACTSXP_02225, partial [Promethearchaeota archaeon]